MHVKMTRIESGVTVPKGLFTLYMNVKIVTAKYFLAPIVSINFVKLGNRQPVKPVCSGVAHRRSG
jgi:hypothetical protein